MKYLIVILTSLLYQIVALCGNVDNDLVADPYVLIMSEGILVHHMMTETTQEDVFSSVSYDMVSNNLSFDTCAKIEKIFVYNNHGILEFQLPVSSYKVMINKNLFASGKYVLSIKLKGSENPQLVHLDIS